MPRYSQDFDTFIRATRENAERLVAALEEFGFGAPAKQFDVDAWIARGRTLELGRPPNQIHVLTRISGVTFDEAVEEHVASVYGTIPVRFIGLAALIRNKLAAGRPKDLADVARIVVDGEPLAVIGVVPAEFRFPRWDTVIWRARDFSAQSAGRAEDRPTAYVRFSGDMPRDDALRLATSAAHAVDSTTLELRARGTPVSGLMIDDDHARAVPLLTGGVLLVFLALCANVCSLLLARLSARRREFSMRAALGASRVRLIRQAFVESVLLGALGVLAGLAFAWVLISIARTFLPEAFLLRTLNPLNLDIRGVAVASAAGVVATVAAGLLPAWLGTRADVGDSLRVVERGGTETRGARAVTRTLLVAEIALACTLLTGATLLVRSFVNLSRADRGLDTSGVVIANLSFPRAAFPDALSRASVARAIEYEVARLPGVELVAWTYGVPPAQGNLGFGEWTSDAPEVRPVNTVVDSYHVGPEFFALYRIPLLRGRTFGPGDPPETIIVGERLAGMLWPGLDPIGRSLDHGTERMQVIGVAREIHHPSLDAQVDRPEFYRPVSGISSYPTLNIRCSGRCPDAAVVRQRIASTSAALRDISVRPLDDVYFEQLARPRAAAALGLAFAAIALLAAAGGLFSVLTYAVANRRREFGIRTALGASPADVRRAVLGDGATVAALGVAVGGIAAWVAARAIASVHHGVTAHDPMAWAVMLGSVGVATVAASWRPAREAARVDPVLLLREE